MIKLGIQTGTTNNSATKNKETNRAAFITEVKELSMWIQVRDEGGSALTMVRREKEMGV